MTGEAKLIKSGKRILEKLGENMYQDITLQLKSGKYLPHQGKRECARRLRQAARRRVTGG